LQQKIDAMNEKLAKEKNQFAMLMDQVNEMKSYVQQLETLETEIRNKSGSLLLPIEGTGGSGGAERLSLDSPVIEEKLETDEMIKHTSDTLLSLEREIPEKIKNVKHLLQDVDAMNRKLIHTPSIYPAIGRITSRFGNRPDPFHGATRFHDGFDIAGYYRSPIYATADGKVVFADRKQGYGKTVQIVHSKTLQTSYSHLSEIIVSVGDSVTKGQIIGYMGSTGRSTGVHVHYMVYENGRPVDPEKYLPIRRR
jgi:murein DD-endopeptidase MepM/ murein hydrolase activator NlpD